MQPLDLIGLSNSVYVVYRESDGLQIFIHLGIRAEEPLRISPTPSKPPFWIDPKIERVERSYIDATLAAYEVAKEYGKLAYINDLDDGHVVTVPIPEPVFFTKDRIIDIMSKKRQDS